MKRRILDVLMPIVLLVVIYIIGASHGYKMMKHLEYKSPPTIIGKKIAYIYPSYEEYECIGYSCGLIGLKKSNGNIIWVSTCGRTAIKERTDDK